MGKLKWMEYQDFILAHVPRTMTKERYKRYRGKYRKAVKNVLTKSISQGVQGTMFGATMLISKPQAPSGL